MIKQIRIFSSIEILPYRVIFNILLQRHMHESLMDIKRHNNNIYSTLRSIGFASIYNKTKETS